MYNLKILCSAVLAAVVIFVGTAFFARIANTYPVAIGDQSTEQATQSDSANVPIKVGEPIIIKDKKK